MAKAKKAESSGPKFHYCEQGSHEWRMVKLGIPSASEFGAIMAKSDERAGRTRLLHRLAGEIMSGEPSEEWSNRHMERGKRLEPLARARYEQVRGVAVDQIGFAENFSGLRHCGCSPDGLVGFDGGLEIKTELPELMIPRLLRGAAGPGEHRAQIMGNMYVTERSEWDLMVFWPGMPDFIVTIYRDDQYIAEIDREIQRFNYDLKGLVDRLRKMGIR